MDSKVDIDMVNLNSTGLLLFNISYMRSLLFWTSLQGEVSSVIFIKKQINM